MAKFTLSALMALAMSWSSFGATEPREFFEQLVGTGDRQVPGGVAAYVEGDSTFLGAWGVATLDNPQMIDTEKSVLPIASVSKVVTAYTLLTLVADGLVDLDQSVSKLLPGLQIPPEVTVRHLLSQTSGLQDRFTGTATRNADDPRTLADMLKQLPAFSFAPGEVYRYSNWNAALQGLVIEQVTGLSFEEAVRMRVFDPLGMNSSFYSREKHPAQSNGVLNHDYDWEAGWFTTDLYYVLLEPAGGMMSTAQDMGKFIEHLLSEEVQQCPARSRLFSSEWRAYPEAVETASFGMIVRDHQGVRIASHRGDFIGTSSCIVLFPEKKTGYFVVCNSENYTLAESWREFVAKQYGLDQYPQAASPKPGSATPGTYRDIRFWRTGRTPERLAFLVGTSDLRVDDKSLVYPLVVQSKPGRQFVARGLDIYVKTSWYESATFVLSLIACLTGMQLLLLPITCWRFRSARKAEEKSSTRYWLTTGVGLLLGLLSMTFIGISLITTPPMEFLFGYPWEFQLATWFARMQALTLLVLLALRICAARGRTMGVTLSICSLGVMTILSAAYYALGILL